MHHASTLQTIEHWPCQPCARTIHFIPLPLLAGVAIHSGTSHIYILAYASWSLVGLFLFVKFYFTNVRLGHVILYLVYHPDLAREMLDVFPVQPFHKVESNDPPRSVRLVHDFEGDRWLRRLPCLMALGVVERHPFIQSWSSFPSLARKVLVGIESLSLKQYNFLEEPNVLISNMFGKYWFKDIMSLNTIPC